MCFWEKKSLFFHFHFYFFEDKWFAICLNVNAKWKGGTHYHDDRCLSCLGSRAYNGRLYKDIIILLLLLRVRYIFRRSEKRDPSRRKNNSLISKRLKMSNGSFWLALFLSLQWTKRNGQLTWRAFTRAKVYTSTADIFQTLILNKFQLNWKNLPVFWKM